MNKLGINKFVTCINCFGVKKKIRSEYRGIGFGYVYRDSSGRKWLGKRCYECSLKYQWVHNGQRSLDKSKNPQVISWRKSEHIVAKYFRDMGFDVELTKNQGPDIIARIGSSITITCEVKRLGKYGCGYFRTTPVKPKRKKDDLVAYVYPNQTIEIIEMSKHLDLCSGWGARNFNPKKLIKMGIRCEKFSEPDPNSSIQEGAILFDTGTK